MVMYLVYQSVCPIVCDLTLVNIVALAGNFSMLLIFTSARFLLKTKNVTLIICLPDQPKVFRYIALYGNRSFKVYFTSAVPFETYRN